MCAIWYKLPSNMSTMQDPNTNVCEAGACRRGGWAEFYHIPSDPSQFFSKKIKSTVCPGSSNPFYILSYFIKWVTTSWTYSIQKDFFTPPRPGPPDRVSEIFRSGGPDLLRGGGANTEHFTLRHLLRRKKKACMPLMPRRQ